METRLKNYDFPFSLISMFLIYTKSSCDLANSFRPYLAEDIHYYV